MAIERDLMIEQGETLSIDLRWVTKSTKAPIDLTGCEFVLQARAEKASTSPILLNMTTTGGQIPITDALDGKFKLFLTDEETYALALPAEPTNKRAWYELVCGFSTGEKRKLWKGQVIFYKATVYP